MSGYGEGAGARRGPLELDPDWFGRLARPRVPLTEAERLIAEADRASRVPSMRARARAGLDVFTGELRPRRALAEVARELEPLDPDLADRAAILDAFERAAEPGEVHDEADEDGAQVAQVAQVDAEGDPGDRPASWAA